jgi:hypothetical protein
MRSEVQVLSGHYTGFDLQKRTTEVFVDRRASTHLDTDEVHGTKSLRALIAF